MIRKTMSPPIERDTEQMTSQHPRSDGVPAENLIHAGDRAFTGTHARMQS
jgi:hypothetical protein